MIEGISLHHFGGIGNDQRAKTQHLTLETIEAAHKARFNMKSSLGFWTTYNFVLFPDRWVQTRAIGEEGAHTRGFNLDYIGTAFSGNFTPSVERPLTRQINDCVFLLGKLFDGRKAAEEAGIKFYKNTLLDLKFQNIKPHRQFLGSLTDCYGWGLPDNWGRELIRPYFIDKIGLLTKILWQLMDTVRSTRSAIIKKELSLGAKNVPCWLSDQYDYV